MRIYDTEGLSPNRRLSDDDRSWIYNGLDCCVTLEVRDQLHIDLAREPDHIKDTYRRAMGKLAPVLDMSMRGLKRDEVRTREVIGEYEKELAALTSRFDTLMREVVGYTVNPRSPTQLKTLFYSTFGLRPKRKRNAQGEYAPTLNREALEAFQEYTYIAPFCLYILAIRDLGKKLGFLRTRTDADGRMRTSLNIAGTKTGRLASAMSDFGTGTNLQNIENLLRSIFIADPGYVLVNVDLEQADARNVGASIYEIYYDKYGPERAGAYLDACESGDLHTRVCSMAWGELEWPEPWDAKLARSIADANAYRDMSYRDLAKRLGHGTNYLGTPPTMAAHTKTERGLIEEFQLRYFTAFPLIGSTNKEDKTKDNWHNWVYNQLRTLGSITTLFGRRRNFYGRYNDAETLRDAVAYGPQSMTAEEIDRGYTQLYHGMPEAQLLIQVHDSILFQLPFEALDELLPKAMKLLEVELFLKGGRRFSVPLEAKTGWNWADVKYNEDGSVKDNEYGLAKWKGREDRTPPKPRTPKRRRYFFKG